MNLIQRTILRLFNGQLNVSAQAEGELLAWDNTAGEWQNKTAGEMFAYSDHTPTFGVSGGTISTTSTSFYRYCQIGKTVIGEYKINFVTGSTADYITVSLPIAQENSGSLVNFGALATNSSSAAVCQAFAFADVIRIFPTATQTVTWTDTSHNVWGSFSYEGE